MTRFAPLLSPLGRWYAVLAVLASVAAVRASLFPSWPRATPLSMDSVLHSLRKVGLRPEPVITTAADKQGDRSQELSVSAPLVLRLRGGEELRLVHGAFRQRYALQTAAIAAKSPDTKLEERVIFAKPAPFAEGRIKGQPARQTCFVPQAQKTNALGATNEQILIWIDSTTGGRTAKALRMLGFIPARDYSCTLISLRSNNNTPINPLLWNQIIAALPAGLSEISIGAIRASPPP